MARYLFLLAKTKDRKFKQKTEGKNLPVARAKPAHSAQQAQRGTGVFFPVPRLQAARWNATERAEDDTSPPCASRPPRGLFSRLETPLFRPHPFPPPELPPPPPVFDFVTTRV